MNELLRLDYLEAMGITQYVARMPLPGARLSPVIEIETVTVEQQPARITELLDEHIPAARKSPVSPSPASRAPAQASATEPTALQAVFPVPDCHLDGC